MELADLTRDIRKKQCFRAWFFFFARPGLSEFHKSSAGKSNFLEPEKLLFFAKPGLSELHKRSAEKKQLFRAWKVFFAKPGLSEFQKSSAEKKQFFRAWKVFFAKPGLSEFQKSSAEKEHFFRAWKIVFFARPGLSEFQKSSAEKKQFFRAWKVVFFQSRARLTFTRKMLWRQGSCSIMVRVAEFALDGRRFAPRRRILWASKRVCQYVVFLVPVVSFLGKIVFLQSLSFLQVIGETNVSSPQVYPHIEFAWIGSGPSTREKKQFFGAWKIVFLQSPISSHKTMRGHSTKKMPQRGIANFTYKRYFQNVAILFQGPSNS